MLKTSGYIYQNFFPVKILLLVLFNAHFCLLQSIQMNFAVLMNFIPADVILLSSLAFVVSYKISKGLIVSE